MLWATVEAPTPPLAPTKAIVRPTGLAPGAANRPEIAAIDVARPSGAIRYSLTPAPHQLAVEGDVVDVADDDDLGAGVADLGQRIEAVERLVAAPCGLDDDDVGRRRVPIGLDRGGAAAHLDLEMRLLHAPVVAGALHGGRGLAGLAERLHRHPRDRRDVLMRTTGSEATASAGAAWNACVII